MEIRTIASQIFRSEIVRDDHDDVWTCGLGV